MAGRGDAADEDDAVDGADWASIAKAAAIELQAVAEDGARRTLIVLGVADDESITRQTFTKAVDAAKARAAELVGKSWNDDGELVDNPDAEWTITDTTRDAIREAVAQAIEDGDSAAELSDRIESLGAFSEERATMIARTEIIRSHAQGQMAAMRESGVVEQKSWSSAGEEVCDECSANEDLGPIDLDEDFDGGDEPVDAPPMHPGCRCNVQAYIPVSGEDDESDDEEDDQGEDEEAAE